MGQGYNEDHNPEGGLDGKIYNLEYWQYCDIFVYFSHCRVTVPPPSWVNVAHKNGTRVLVRFSFPLSSNSSDLPFECLKLNVITEEWDKEKTPVETLRLIYGQEIDHDHRCNLKFSPYYADKLVQMTKFLNLDGIFLNIEAVLPDTRHAIQLSLFVKYLTRKCHDEIPNSLVIWYDSVTIEGNLKWQDRLTDLNYPFFEACDGIFLNYTWKKEYPDETLALLSKHNTLTRRHDVYVGTDVWGRNTYGGGGFNTFRALERIKKADLSYALFAPAWTYEFLSKDDFRRNERRFWVDPNERTPVVEEPTEKSDLILDGRRGCVGSVIDVRRVPGETGFWTDFNLGVGKAWFEEGVCLRRGHWSNFSLASILPTYRDSQKNACGINLNADSTSFTKGRTEDARLFWYVDTEFEGNGSVWSGGSRLHILLAPSKTPIVFQLFKTDFRILSTSVAGFRSQSSTSLELGLYVEVDLNSTLQGAVLSSSKVDVTDGWTLRTFDMSEFSGASIVSLGIAILPFVVPTLTIAGCAVFHEKAIHSQKVIADDIETKSQDMSLFIGEIFLKPEFQLLERAHFGEVHVSDIYIPTPDSKTGYCTLYWSFAVNCVTASEGTALDTVTKTRMVNLSFQVSVDGTHVLSTTHLQARLCIQNINKDFRYSIKARCNGSCLGTTEGVWRLESCGG